MIRDLYEFVHYLFPGGHTDHYHRLDRTFYSVTNVHTSTTVLTRTPYSRNSYLVVTSPGVPVCGGGTLTSFYFPLDFPVTGSKLDLVGYPKRSPVDYGLGRIRPRCTSIGGREVGKCDLEVHF